MTDVHLAVRWNDVSLSDVRLANNCQQPLLQPPTNCFDVTDTGLLSSTGSISPFSSPLSLVSAASEPPDGDNSVSMNSYFVSDESSIDNDPCMYDRPIPVIVHDYRPLERRKSQRLSTDRSLRAVQTSHFLCRMFLTVMYEEGLLQNLMN